MFENEMTFVKIYSKESELSAIRRYASLKNYIRDRNRRERLNDLEEAPTPRERLNDDLEEASTPPFEKGGKDKKNNVSHNNSTLGGSISSSTSNNSTAVTDTAASIRQLSKRKKAKNSKTTTSASQQNASSSNVVENSDNVKKRHLYTSLKPKFLRKNTSSRILKTGGGGVIEFLPSDVRSLRKQLTYLIGEYRAGNRSLKNKIAAILKNLHSRKVMTKREYDMEINSIFR